MSHSINKLVVSVPSVIDAIRNRIIKERITDTTTLNYDKMRDILRKLGLNKYFEHSSRSNFIKLNKFIVLSLRENEI